MDFLQNVKKENTILNQEYKEEKLKKLVLKIVEKDKVEKEINKVGNYFIFFVLNDKIIYESRCNMKFLVTGGAGFIASNYLHYVTEKYPEDYFVCLDSLTYAGNYNNIKDLEEKDNYKFVYGDITDRDFVYDLFSKEKFDCIINFAAESHVDNSIKDPEIFLRTNIIGTEVLMDACLKYGVKRYHQVSTDEVYGDLPLDRPDLLFREDTPIHTSSPYSTSKASADLLVMAYYRTYGLPVTISRCSNNYGPYQFPRKINT